MADAPVAVGDVVCGRYRIDRLIGAGSMGFVVAAWHLELDQPVAIKFLNPDVLERNEAAKRFRREVRATAKIKSEHVTRVIDVGALENGVPFMVMELLQGNNLEDELLRRGLLPVDEAVGYMLEAIEAIAEAHAAGIVHRDLKPANLFVARRADRSRLVKVLDFGISKSLLDSHQPGDMSLTAAGVIIGSPLYMSPEQMRSTKDADYRSDIWSLGAILFQLVTGRPPYLGETIPEICAQLYVDPVPAPSTVLPTLPPEIDRVLARALERDPDQRYQTVAEFGAALADLAPPESRVHAERAQRVLAVTRGAAPSSEWPRARVEQAPTIEASVSILSAGSPRFGARAWLGAALGVALAAILVLGFFVMRRMERAAAPLETGVAAAAVRVVEDTNPRPREPVATAARTLVEAAPAPAVAEAPPLVASASPAVVRAPLPGARPKPRRAPSEAAGNVPDFGGRR